MTPPGRDPTVTTETTPRQPARKATTSTSRTSSTRRSSRAPAAAKQTRAGAPSGDAELGTIESEGRRGSWPGRGRAGRGLYDRTWQRRHEQWSLAARAASWLLARPETVLSAFGSPPAAAVDGRVLHRGVQAVLEIVARAPAAEVEWGPGTDVQLARKRMRQTLEFTTPLRTDIYSSGRLVPGPEGAPPIPVRVYRRFGAVDRGTSRPSAIVYFHGGGWVIGDVQAYERTCRLLAAVSRCTVVSVDYRLAPEHPFPAPVDDCLAAYQWVQRHTDELGVAEGSVAVMGDSAGGNLAAVVSLLTRRGGRGAAPDVPTPLAVGLVYPATDARMASDSHRRLGDGYLLTRAEMEWFRGHYLPDESDWATPEASPLLAAHHRDLPPTLVVTAGFDPLRDEGLAYASALRTAGVPVTDLCYDDQVHGFLGMGVVPDCRSITVEVFEAMGRLVRAAAETRAGAT